MKLRVPPSGPVIADIGAGFRIRLAEGRITVSGGSQAIQTSPGTIGLVLNVAPALVIGFSDGPPVQTYRATLVCDVQNTSNAEGTVQLDIEVSWDSAATFVSASKSTHKVEAATARQLRVDCPAITPPTGAVTALFRGVISDSLDGTHLLLLSPTTGPTIDLQVEELLASS